ncbi:DUF2079 domain-containing protein [bacterium]|nr:DUF2079 domain-containing protein [bacterium]
MIQDPDFVSTVQTVWKLMVGEFPETTLFYKHYLANHWMPILEPISWLYRIFPYPWVLLIFSSVICLFGMDGLRRLTESLTQSAMFSYVVCLSFLSHPLFSIAILGRVNTDIYLFSFLVWALYLGLTKRSFLSFLFVVLSWMCKEDSGLYTVLIGFILVYVLSKKSTSFKFQYGYLLIAISFLAFTMINGWVMPSYRVPGSVGNLHWYAHLGGSFTEIVWRSLTQPIFVVKTIFTPNRLYGLSFLLIPVIGVAFRTSRFLWIPVLPILIKMLSSNSDAIGFQKHHFWIPSLFLYISLILGASFLKNREKGAFDRYSLSLFVVSIFFFCLNFSTFIPNHVESFSLVERGREIRNELKGLHRNGMSSTDRVLSDSQLLATLANRRYVYELNPYVIKNGGGYDNFRLTILEQDILLDRVNFIIFDRRKGIERNTNLYSNKLQIIEQVKTRTEWDVFQDSDLLFVARKD